MTDAEAAEKIWAELEAELNAILPDEYQATAKGLKALAWIVELRDRIIAGEVGKLGTLRIAAKRILFLFRAARCLRCGATEDGAIGLVHHKGRQDKQDPSDYWLCGKHLNE